MDWRLSAWTTQTSTKIITWRLSKFDLVCDRKWLRSFVSSSALIGMLLSSVSLGLLSDKFGRLRCIEFGMGLSALATVGAILAHNYLLFNVFILIMSYAQVGAANALCTLVMEATSPRFRFIPVFEYGIGWGLGVIAAPLLNEITHNYVTFLILLLAWQLLMLPWLHFGVFESIRWLLSEGQINRAQIELQRACRMNKVRNGAKLAQEIAQIQAQQMRKASRIIEDDVAPARLARILEQKVDKTAQDLDVLSAAIRQSFGFTDSEEDKVEDTNKSAKPADELPTNLALVPTLSPTLHRCSFSLATPDGAPAVPPPPRPRDSSMHEISLAWDPNETLHFTDGAKKVSLTTQGIIQLAMKYRKALEQEEEGGCFLVKMFHRKLWKITFLLMLISIMLETSYYGFIQANKFVGDSVNLNYIIGGIGEWLAASLYMLVLWAFSRRTAVIAPTGFAALICLGMALSYHLIPNGEHNRPTVIRLQDLAINGEDMDPLDELLLSSRNATTVAVKEVQNAASSIQIWLHLSASELLELRERINFWLMTFGKLTVTVGIQVAATIAMESYPNNLRQTGSGVMLFCGRIGSIVAPFLFNDPTEDKIVLKATLVVLFAIGLIVCLLTPFFLSNNKDKELSDHLQDVES